MHPTLNYRHSRRSACDKCRGQKLRCERGHMNGMSCERCLKAQQPCITSMNHPTPVFLPSNHDQSISQRDRDAHMFGHGHDLMSMLPKSSSAKGGSCFMSSSTNPGIPTTLQSNCWDDQMLLPYLSGDNLFSLPEDLSLGMLDPRVFPNPFESRSRQPHWSNENYNLSPSESALPELTHQHSDESLYSPVLGTDISTDVGNEGVTTGQISLPDRQPIYPGTAPMFEAENFPESFWGNIETLPNPAEFLPRVHRQEKPNTIKNVRTNLLKLKIELHEDLEMLEMDSAVLASEPLLNDLFNPSIAHLNLPICRIHNHSSRLLEVIKSLHMVSEISTFTPAKSPTQSPSGGLEYSNLVFQDVSDNRLDEHATTIVSHDSGYQPAMTTSPGRPMTTISPKCDITLWLGVLEAHCYLTRIYRAIFTRLYQFFLEIPPVDAAMYLLLPKLQLGQFHMDGNLAVQVQVLVDLSSSAMGQIDELLGLLSGYNQNPGLKESSSTGASGEGSWPRTIRDLVLAQEQDSCEMSLMDLMKCLRQLVRDPIFL